MRKNILYPFMASVLLMAHLGYSQVQTKPATTDTESTLPDAPMPTTKQVIVHFPSSILKDQEGVWTSPAKIRVRDLRWILPLAAATGAGLATDHHTMRDVVSHDPQFNQDSVNTSDALVGGLIAIPAALYGVGIVHKDEHAERTGVLSAESVVDGLIVQEGLKLIAWRERPSQDDSRGKFFQGNAGFDSAFPSGHSTVAWSSAAVIASEYPSRWVQLGVYSMAAGVSLTRVLGQQHFPTDVLIGSVTGWAIGKYVVRHHRGDRQ